MVHVRDPLSVFNHMLFARVVACNYRLEPSRRALANRNEFHWSAEAAAIFQDAVTELGGPASAMPSAIIQILSLGPLHHLTSPQVNSRLQKVRKQARAATSQLQTHAVAPAAPAPKKPKRKRAYSTGNLSDDDFDCPR